MSRGRTAESAQMAPDPSRERAFVFECVRERDVVCERERDGVCERERDSVFEGER